MRARFAMGTYAAAGPEMKQQTARMAFINDVTQAPTSSGCSPLRAHSLSTARRTTTAGGARTAARRVLEQVRVHLVRGKRDVADDGAADEAVLDREHVRVPRGVRDGDAVEPDVQEPAGAQRDTGR
jgi:hypothetical protein